MCFCFDIWHSEMLVELDRIHKESYRCAINSAVSSHVLFCYCIVEFECLLTHNT